MQVSITNVRPKFPSLTFFNQKSKFLIVKSKTSLYNFKKGKFTTMEKGKNVEEETTIEELEK